MNVLAWNCWGLGSTSVVWILTDEVKSKRPILIFLVKTKASSSKVKGILNKLELTQGISIPSDGRSGGLAMLWTEGTDIHFKSYSHLHIDVVVVGEHGGAVESYGFLRTPQCKQKAHLMEVVGNIEGAM